MIATESRGDPRGTIALIGIGLLAVVLSLVYGSHGVKMWRIRRRERDEARHKEGARKDDD